MVNKAEWVICPECKNKTRKKIREDTELVNFPCSVLSAKRKV